MSNVTVHSESEFASFQTHFPGILWSIFLAAISAFLLAICTSLCSYVYPLFSANGVKKMHQLGGLSIFNAWVFFNKRYDFLRSNQEKTGRALFSFKVFQASMNLLQWSIS